GARHRPRSRGPCAAGVDRPSGSGRGPRRDLPPHQRGARRRAPDRRAASGGAAARRERGDRRGAAPRPRRTHAGTVTTPFQRSRQMGLVILLVVVAVLVLWVISAFNGLVTLKNQVLNAWKQIDVQLKRRHDLIPNLVNTVKGAMDFERGTLEAVISARNKAVSATGVKETARAEGELTQALGRLFALTEAYPELKSNSNILALQEELTSTENKVGFARQHYNDAATVYNT